MIRHIDLFSGIGGFSLGFERAGMTTIEFCENDQRAMKVIRQHWPHVPLHDDVLNMKFETDGAEVISAGFPCQDVSNANASWGDCAGLAGTRSGLYGEAIRAIRVVRPQFAVLENVAALLGRGMETILRDLAEIGYDAEWDCIRAMDAGLPHERDRIWIVAYPCGSRGQRLVTSADIGTLGQGGGCVARRICALSPTLRSSGEIVGLNPSFGEWMMDYPEGWTDCICSATRSSRPSRK